MTEGEIIATCGHRISRAWFGNSNSNCITKSQARDGAPALSYSVLCFDCRVAADKSGDLFWYGEDAEAWLRAESEKWFARSPLSETER